MDIGECKAGFDCHDQEPYGFVPEADCPIHDRPGHGVSAQEAAGIIKAFFDSGGSVFIDGCSGKMPESDLISLAEDCLILRCKESMKRLKEKNRKMLEKKGWR